MPDTYRVNHALEQNISDTAPETLSGTGCVDTYKLSDCAVVEVSNKTFTGSPSEQDVDAVRGAVLAFKDNAHGSTAQFHYELKGGIVGWAVLRCYVMGSRRLKIRIGDYTIYDGDGCPWYRTSSLPRTTGGVVTRAAFGPKPLVWLYHADLPAIGKIRFMLPWLLYVGAEAVVLRVPPPVVWGYFLARRVFFRRGWQS